MLRDLDLEVAAGEVTGLLGPSGCGKTTLMRVIVGVQRITAGRVEVLGEPAGSASLRSRIGYVTQQPSVYDDLTVAENLRFFARSSGSAPTGSTECLEHRRPRASTPTGSSAAVRAASARGSSLAVALLGEPDLLVLDEPTVGLDPVLRAELWATFHELAAAGATVLVSSHVMDEADALRPAAAAARRAADRRRHPGRAARAHRCRRHRARVPRASSARTPS